MSKEPERGGCTGACCAVFYMPRTKRDLERLAAKGELEDGDFIAQMLVPLTVDEARDRASRFGSAIRGLHRHAGHYFTCRHWDEETRLCTVYDERPRMCSEYPYGEACKLAAACAFKITKKALAARKRRRAARVA